MKTLSNTEAELKKVLLRKKTSKLHYDNHSFHLREPDAQSL